MMQQFTAIITRDEDWFVAFCPELDIAGQGQSIQESKKNLTEAIELFLETASPSEIQARTIGSERLSPERSVHEIMVNARRLRRLTATYPISDDEFCRAKVAGRP